MQSSVVDSDTHVVEDEHVWEYLTPSDQAHRPVVLAANTRAAAKAYRSGGNAFWLIDGELYPRGGQSLISYPQGTRDLGDVEARINHMDELAIDVQVIYPSLFLGLSTRHPEADLALGRAYNRWLADTCSEHVTRMRWVAVPSTQDIDASVKDMKEWSDRGACGVMLRGLEMERVFTHEDLWPLFAAASDYGLPICIHIGGSSRGFRNIEGINNPVGILAPNLIGFAALVTSEVPTRFPDLKFGFIESGAEWLPFAISRAQRYEIRYDIKNQSDRMLAEERLFVTCESHENINQIAGMVGDRALILGTDYGHSDTSTALRAPTLLKERDDISTTLATRIVSDNAAKFYRF